MAGGLTGLLLAAGVRAESIPTVRCDSLAGLRVSLPEDLHGRPAVLVVGFSREAQGAVRDWGRRLAAEYGASGTVGYYEVAMLAGAPRLVRGLIVRAMKKDVSERGQAHFLPVADHEAEWRALAHYDRPEAAYVVVVDGVGNVRWTASGALTESAYAEMKRRLGP